MSLSVHRLTEWSGGRETEMTMTTNLQVAETIRQQLGGARFAVMTGAKNFVAGENMLLFSVGRGAKAGINKVRVTLDPSDTYTVEFFRIRGVNVKTIAKHSDIYCDQLQDVFTSETGFYTRF